MAKFNRFKNFYTSNTPTEFKKIHRLEVGKYTASMVPNCIGYGHTSPAKMQFCLKTGTKPDDKSDFAQAAMDWGNHHENTALKQTIQQYELYKGTKYHVVRPGIVYHPVLEDKLGATPDAVITDGKEVINVEIKCPYFWGKIKAPEEVHHLDVFPLKEKWAIQPLIQMECLPLEKTLLGVWTPERTFLMELPRKPLIFKYIWSELMHFENKVKHDDTIKLWKKDTYLKGMLEDYLTNQIHYIKDGHSEQEHDS
jgi:hypothetical protein